MMHNISESDLKVTNCAIHMLGATEEYYKAIIGIF